MTEHLEPEPLRDSETNVVAGKLTRSIGDLGPLDWQIRSVRDVRVPSGPVPHFFFGCPLRGGLCGVPIKPSLPNRLGYLWSWDETTRTLSPSIHCTKQHGGCGFHKSLIRGEWR